jgi:hypothetical protein
MGVSSLPRKAEIAGQRLPAPTHELRERDRKNQRAAIEQILHEGIDSGNRRPGDVASRYTATVNSASAPAGVTAKENQQKSLILAVRRKSRRGHRRTNALGNPAVGDLPAGATSSQPCRLAGRSHLPRRAEAPLFRRRLTAAGRQGWP